MIDKHLPNRELEILNTKTDYFGHIDKGNAIIAFLKSSIDLKQTNMIALYGKWGSGKSTLMKYIGTELDNGNYKSLYFPAWEFEKDENLPLSLMHFISDKTGTSSIKVVKDFLDLAGDALLSGIKSVTIDAGIVKVNPKIIIDSAKEFDEKNKEKKKSAYNNTKEFKKKFIEAEKTIIEKTAKEKLIIFIDDLDRCEPENVLNLISIIKLFFTYSENIVFVFGCDKDAISKAVQYKYGEIIKADEYLEKVIDISFNMPKEISIKKLTEFYFPEHIECEGKQIIISDELEDFFKTINFVNPRQLKKALNKIEVLKSFKKLEFPQNNLIPKLTVDTEQDLMIVEFILFFVILHEFYNKTFLDLLRFSQKKASYTNIYRETMAINHNQTKVPFSSANSALLSNCCVLNDLNQSFDNIIGLIKTKSGRMSDELLFNYFLTIFTPVLYSDRLDGDSGRLFSSQFYHENNSEGDIIALKFCEFLIRKQNVVLSLKSDYKVIDFFRMCEVLL